MDLFHSREWVLSIVQAVSSLQVTRRIFRKTWSSSTAQDSPGAFTIFYLHEWVHYTESIYVWQLKKDGDTVLIFVIEGI